MGQTSGSNAIYNRNWLSYQFMKASLLIWVILFRGNRVEVREALKGNARVLNTKNNGYEAEAHFLGLIVMVEFFIVWAVTMLTGAISISSMFIPGDFYLHPGYTGFTSSIPFSLMFIHTWKSLNLEIIKARKIPYRKKSGYFTEARNKDLVFPAITLILATLVAMLMES